MRGFTVIELLVATALVVVVMCAVGVLAPPMRRAFDRGLSGGELASRGRTALSAVVSEIKSAGSGIVIGPADVALGDVIPVITVMSPSSIAITRASGPQGVLRHHVDAGATSIRLDTSEPCSEQDATCGIRAHDVVAIFDRVNGQTVAVSSVSSDSATLHLSSPLVHAFDAGAVIAAVAQTAFTLRAGRLVRTSAGGAEQPVIDHVASFNAGVAPGRLDLSLALDPASPVSAGFTLHTSVAFRQ